MDWRLTWDLRISELGSSRTLVNRWLFHKGILLISMISILCFSIQWPVFSSKANYWGHAVLLCNHGRPVQHLNLLQELCQSLLYTRTTCRINSAFIKSMPKRKPQFIWNPTLNAKLQTKQNSSICTCPVLLVLLLISFTTLGGSSSASL